MLSDTELVDRLREILRSSDLNNTTPGSVRRQLEQEFAVDLSDRKKFIARQIDEFLESYASALENADQPECTGDDGDGDDDGGGEQVGDEEGEEEEEEEEDEEEASGGEKQRPKDEEMTKKKKGTGFTKLCSLSAQLQEFVGVSEMARTEVVRKLWAYIRENSLQDPNNKRNINCDKKLHSIFRVDSINMFQMNKALSNHIWPLEAEGPAAHFPPREKKQKRQKEEDVENSKRKAKHQKGGTTGYLKPLQLSDAFVNFLGTGETTLSRADAVKRIWDYIKQNNLQDPSDKRRILCDEKLKDLFDVDSFIGFSVSKLLTAHLTKMEQ